jgi:class 3 adenylate cyclase/tetratricopeptide (TPR) repeat protein
MPVCGTCGTDNPADARFCMNCAAPLTPIPSREVRKTITVVFTDLVGSTGLGDRLDPEAVSRITARYFERMRAVIERHGGQVEKFIGDAVVGVFGMPRVHEDDALRAVRAASEMREDLAELNREFGGQWGARLTARTGVNTGQVLARSVADVGPMTTGDVMNVGARLEQFAGPDEIVIGAETYRLVHDVVDAEPLDRLALKGKSATVTAFRLLRLTDDRAHGVARVRSPMVGRQDDKAQLRSAYYKVLDERRARMVTVLGPAGVGKSRLVSEFLDEVGGEAFVLGGRCLPYGEGITYWPVAEIVREAAGLTAIDTDKGARAKIARLLEGEADAPFVASRVGAAIGLSGAAVPAEEVPWAVRKLLEALSRTRPVVVVFDDIQWGEPAFLDLVEQVPGPDVDVSLLVVCMARTELLDVRPEWGQKPGSSVIPLAQLADMESELLLANLLEAASVLMPVERVVRAAEGNPLYLEQMATMLLERSGEVEQDAPFPEGLHERTAPPTIQALLGARLDRLDPPEREVLERAAVVGEVFYWDAVAELTAGETPLDLGRILMSLVGKELIRPEHSDVAGQDAFRFHHLLIRDEAYRSLPRKTRADLHEQYAAWLEWAVGARAGEYEEIVGYHLEKAYENRSALGPVDERTSGLAERAAEHLASAGHRALDRGDLPSAVNLLERADRLSTDQDPRLLIDLGLAQWDSGDFTRAGLSIDAAVEAARRTGERGTEWMALIEREGLRLTQTTAGGVPGEVLRTASQAIDVFEEMSDERGLARAWLVISNAHNQVGDHGPMLDAAKRAVEHARRAGDERLEVWGRTVMSSAMTWGPLPVPEGLRAAEVLLARSQGSPLLTASALRVIGNLKALQGEYAEARALADRVLTIYEEFGRSLNVATNLAFHTGQIEMRAGKWAEAERAFRRSSEMLEEMGEHGWLSTIVAQWGDALFKLGRDDEAYRCTERSAELSAPDDQASQIMWRQVRAKVLARRGLRDEAASMAREAVEIADSTAGLVWQADAYAALADVERMNGEPAGEERALREALRRYEAKGMPVQLEMARDRLSSTHPHRP